MPDMELLNYLESKFEDADTKRSTAIGILHKKIDLMQREFHASDIVVAERSVELTSQIKAIKAEVLGVAKTLDDHMANDNTRFGEIGSEDVRADAKHESRVLVVASSLLAATFALAIQMIIKEME